MLISNGHKSLLRLVYRKIEKGKYTGNRDKSARVEEGVKVHE